MASYVDITSYGQGAFKVIIVAALLILMQILMVGGRFVSRKLRKVPLAADDYVLLVAAALTIGLCGLALACKLSQGRVQGRQRLQGATTHARLIHLTQSQG